MNFAFFYFSSLQDACLRRRSLPCIQSKLKSLNHREGTKRLKGRIMFVVVFQIPLSMICYHPYIPKTPNRESIKQLSNMKRPFKVYVELGLYAPLFLLKTLLLSMTGSIIKIPIAQQDFTLEQTLLV